MQRPGEEVTALRVKATFLCRQETPICSDSPSPHPLAYF